MWQNRPLVDLNDGIDASPAAPPNRKGPMFRRVLRWIVIATAVLVAFGFFIGLTKVSSGG